MKTLNARYSVRFWKRRGTRIPRSEFTSCVPKALPICRKTSKKSPNWCAPGSNKNTILFPKDTPRLGKFRTAVFRMKQDSMLYQETRRRHALFLSSKGSLSRFMLLTAVQSFPGLEILQFLEKTLKMPNFRSFRRISKTIKIQSRRSHKKSSPHNLISVWIYSTFLKVITFCHDFMNQSKLVISKLFLPVLLSSSLLGCFSMKLQFFSLLTPFLRDSLLWKIHTNKVQIA